MRPIRSVNKCACDCIATVSIYRHTGCLHSTAFAGLNTRHTDTFSLIMNEQHNHSHEGLQGELHQLKSRINELENRTILLTDQVTHYQTLISSFNLQTSSALHRLYSSGVIKSSLVYQVMNSINAALFEDASSPDLHEDRAKLLTRLEPFVEYNSKILILVNCYSGFYFTALALMAGGEFDTSRYKSEQTTNALVIGKVTRQDYQVIKSQYQYLLSTGRIKLNAFPAKTVGGDVMAKGYPRDGPYDLIIVPEIGWANGLAPQLKVNGAIVNPFSPSDTVQKDATGKLVPI